MDLSGSPAVVSRGRRPRAQNAHDLWCSTPGALPSRASIHPMSSVARRGAVLVRSAGCAPACLVKVRSLIHTAGSSGNRDVACVDPPAGSGVRDMVAVSDARAFRAVLAPSPSDTTRRRQAHPTTYALACLQPSVLAITAPGRVRCAPSAISSWNLTRSFSAGQTRVAGSAAARAPDPGCRRTWSSACSPAAARRGTRTSAASTTSTSPRCSRTLAPRRWRSRAGPAPQGSSVCEKQYHQRHKCRDRLHEKDAA